MTRQQVLDYIITTHGEALQDAGIELTDTPENLFYVLYDVMLYESAGAATQETVADTKIAQLIADKAAAGD
jgi:hypothetical protein